jgi:hypothetical protein
MKKFTIFAILTTLILTTLPACDWGSGSDEPTVIDPTEKLTFDDFDDEAEKLADFHTNMHLAIMEMQIMVADGDSVDDILEQYDEIEKLHGNVIATLENMQTIQGEALIAHLANPNTAFAAEERAEPPSLPITEALLDFFTIGGDPMRDRDDAMRMGIFTAYQDMEKNYPDELRDIIDPLLHDAGINDIQEIFTCSNEALKEVWHNKDTTETAFGDRIDWHEDDIRNALASNNMDDVYNYLDNLTNELMSDEYGTGQYAEYLPPDMANQVIQTIGYEAFEEYIKHRRETMLRIKNEQLAAEAAAAAAAKEQEFQNEMYDAFKDTVENGEYYADGYEPDDTTEVVIAHDPTNDTVVIGKVDTGDTNGLPLPPGDYNVVSTADGNVPMGATGVNVSQGQTTVVHNKTYDPKVQAPGLLNFIKNVGQTTVQIPTKADLNEIKNEIAIKEQLRDQLEHHLEILRSMQGGTFTTISMGASTDLNNQLSQLNSELRKLEKELAEGKLLRTGLDDDDDNDDNDDNNDDDKAESITLHAYGTWSDGEQSGSIDLSFQSDGGPITGHFSGSDWNSTATGYFDGGDGGSVSGNIDGSGGGDVGGIFGTYSFSISGSFGGTVHLSRDFAEGTFKAVTHYDGNSYTERGSWTVSF